MEDNLNQNFLKAVQFFEGKDDALLKQLQELHSGCKDMLKSAPDFDLDPSLKYNGFRSFVKIVSLYFERIILLASRSPGTKTIRKLTEFSDLAPTLVKLLKILQLVLKRSHGLETSDIESLDSVDSQILEALMQIDESDLRPVHALSQRNFWLCPSLRRVINQFYITTLVYEVFGAGKLLRRSRKLECYTQFSLHASVNDVKKAWSAGEKIVNRTIIKVGAFPRGHVSTVRLQRQSRWLIPTSGSVQEVDNSKCDIGTPDKNNRVKTMLIRYGRWGHSPRDSLLIHIPGGGFVALSPKSHEGILRNWAQQLKVPIISIDYRLAPEHKYPCALQDALDAYLFLTSGSQKVVDKIGFHPKNIVLCGDSAGGNLSLALSFVLNDIRKKQSDVLMPAGISVQFPVTNLVLGCFSAARILAVMDPMLAIGIGNVCMAAYTEGADEDEKASVKRNHRPWYRSSRLMEVAHSMQCKLTQPYINLLSGPFNELADVPLFVQACEFDPLLDDAISIAKLWRGPVQVDVIEDVLHGFLAFQVFSREARRGGKLCAKRLGQALRLDSFSTETHETA